MNKEYKIKDLGEASKCLEVRIRRKGKHEIYLDQEEYIEEIIRRFNMKDCKPVKTPLEIAAKFDEVKEIDGKPYQQLIGSLMYISILTRPDISHAVSKLSQYNTKYGQAHWNAAKRLIRYLQGTKELCMTYKKNNSALTGHADADWAGESKDRRSYTGFIFTLANGAVSWESRKQRSVAASTAEAEYMALAESAKEAIYLKNLYQEMEEYDQPVTIFNDNQGAQKLTANQTLSRRTKHIDIRYHFVREAVERKEVEVKYKPTEEMVADYLTKAVPYNKLKFCIERSGLETF